jgi:hypothetical protein
MFELVSLEWMNNVYFKGAQISSNPPLAPALCFQIDGIPAQQLLEALGLKSEDNLAEGSWYVLQLKKGKGAVTGNLYDPDIDMLPRARREFNTTSPTRGGVFPGLKGSSPMGTQPIRSLQRRANTSPCSPATPWSWRSIRSRPTHTRGDYG